MTYPLVDAAVAQTVSDAVEAATGPLLAQLAAAPQPVATSIGNFTDAGPGLILGTTIGRGPTLDSYRLVAGSSDKGPKVPTAQGATNPYVVLSSPKGAATVLWAGLGVYGADVGHLYHLARVDTAGFAYLSGCHFEGSVGNAAGPPGETRVLALPSCREVIVEDCTIDGLGQAADGIGAPYCGTLTYRRVTVAGVQFWCAAWYQTGELVTEGCTFTGGRGLNHEHVALSRHAGLTVNLPPEPQPHSVPPQHYGMHATLNGPAGDHVWDFAAWTGGLYGVNSPLCIRRSTIYEGAVQADVPMPTTSRNGRPLAGFADAGRLADPAGRWKAIPQSNMSAAFSDPQNWAILHH